MFAGARNNRELSIPVDAAQAENATMHFDRSFSRRRPSIDWLGCSARTVGPGSMGSIRNCLPLAVPALHVHRLDVSRRLRSRRIFSATFGRAERSLRDLAELRCLHDSRTDQLDSSAHGRSGSSLFAREYLPGFEFCLLQRTFCLPQVEYRRTKPSQRFHHLSSPIVHSDDARYKIKISWLKQQRVCSCFSVRCFPSLTRWGEAPSSWL